VKIWLLKNSFDYNTRPALHIAESSFVQYPSGSWFAEFLIALLWRLFIEIVCFVPRLEEGNKDYLYQEKRKKT
jgi:hypothetical protein